MIFKICIHVIVKTLHCAASAVGTESAVAAAEAPAIPAAGLGCGPGGAVASFDSSAHCRSHCQQPQPS